MENETRIIRLLEQILAKMDELKETIESVEKSSNLLTLEARASALTSKVSENA
jgi:hypothetical protein